MSLVLAVPWTLPLVFVFSVVLGPSSIQALNPWKVGCQRTRYSRVSALLTLSWTLLVGIADQSCSVLPSLASIYFMNHKQHVWKQSACKSNISQRLRTRIIARKKTIMGDTQSHNTLQSRQSPLQPGLPGQLRQKGSKSTAKYPRFTMSNTHQRHRNFMLSCALKKASSKQTWIYYTRHEKYSTMHLASCAVLLQTSITSQKKQTKPTLLAFDTCTPVDVSVSEATK